MVAEALARDGFAVFPHDPAVLAWADAARDVAIDVLHGPGERRHVGTWFVGVDALPNAADGSIGGVPLAGTWMDHVTLPKTWHSAQLSVIFPGYPRRDPDESEAAHRYRRNRDAAHVDGLLPEGPQRRRHLREPHGFILGLPLNDVASSPLVVWPGSHQVMRDAFAEAFAGAPPEAWGDVDVTDIYQATRRRVFDQCQRVEVRCRPGEAVLMHRHLLHGVAPWQGPSDCAPRMVAYFRPIAPVAYWLDEQN